MFLYPHLNVNEKGHLTIGGMDAVELAKTYGTPAYILNENVIRERCRTYKASLESSYGVSSMPLYASKALSFTQLYRIVEEEGLGVDCVSPGELFTAMKAGFPLDKVYFHGNNKTDADLEMAVDCGVGTVVCDSEEELLALESICERKQKSQKIYLRITPGLDPHTLKAISTGNVDSKFGSPIRTGRAMEIVRIALAQPRLSLQGLHCHIGSQIFSIDPFREAADIMINFMADVSDRFSLTLKELNLGGGPGVPYTAEDPKMDYAAFVKDIGGVVKEACAKRSYPLPSIRIEPGRSIVADAGVTLYTVGTVKVIPGFRTYVSVDGGMPDNPRYALYGSRYTALVANKTNEPQTEKVTLAGRCCESGDLIGEDMPLQKASRGDILAVLCTGAYNYSMASNYNRIPRPPVILIKDGQARIGVRRESFEDLTGCDMPLDGGIV